MSESRIDRDGRTTLPADIRRSLRLRPGDVLTWRHDGRRAVLTRAGAADADPFAVFTEWDGPADRAAYASF